MQGNTIRLGFHGATTMTSDLQTDVLASAHTGFKTLELWAGKVESNCSGLSIGSGNLCNWRSRRGKQP
jgi:hypothetical protein